MPFFSFLFFFDHARTGRKNINCEAHLVMWDGLPHLLVCTTRTIYPGDEIVTSYGTHERVARRQPAIDLHNAFCSQVPTFGSPSRCRTCGHLRCTMTQCQSGTSLSQPRSDVFLLRLRCNKLVELFAEVPGGEKLDPNEPVQTGDIFQADTLDYSWMPESPSFLSHAAAQHQKKPRCGKDSTPSKRGNSEEKR